MFISDPITPFEYCVCVSAPVCWCAYIFIPILDHSIDKICEKTAYSTRKSDTGVLQSNMSGIFAKMSIRRLRISINLSCSCRPYKV